MRSATELLTIALNNKKLFKEEYGLCAYFMKLKDCNIISGEERLYLKKFIRKNVNTRRKQQNKKFYWTPGWWYPRKRWIKKQIKRLTESEL